LETFARVPVDRGNDFVAVQAEQIGQLIGNVVALAEGQVGRAYVNDVRRHVDRQLAPVAVIDDPARRADRDRLVLIGGGEIVVVAALDGLHVEEPGGEGTDHQHDNQAEYTKTHAEPVLR